MDQLERSQAVPDAVSFRAGFCVIKLNTINIRNLLVEGLHFVARNQLQSGEIASWELIGEDIVFSPRLLWSALAYGAIAFADPSSPAFERHVISLLTPRERHATLPLVSAVRWRIRTYLAAQEESNFLWRRGGRNSATATDFLTTAMAAEAMLVAYRPSRHVAALSQLMGEADAIAQFAILHFLAFAGVTSKHAPPDLISPLSPLLCFCAARYARGREGTMAGSVRKLVMSAAGANTWGLNRLVDALVLSAMLDLDADTAISDLAPTLHEEAMEPRLWDWASYSLDGSGSRGTTMALLLNVLLRSSLVVD